MSGQKVAPVLGLKLRVPPRSVHTRERASLGQRAPRRRDSPAVRVFSRKQTTVASDQSFPRFRKSANDHFQFKMSRARLSVMKAAERQLKSRSCSPGIRRHRGQLCRALDASGQRWRDLSELEQWVPAPRAWRAFLHYCARVAPFQRQASVPLKKIRIGTRPASWRMSRRSFWTAAHRRKWLKACNRHCRIVQFLSPEIFYSSAGRR
jgi:hypothetical protein